MPEEHLDLLKLTAGSTAQLRARAAQVVGCDAGDTDFGSVLPEHRPDDFFAEALTGDGARAVQRTEHVTDGDPGGRRPRVDGDFHPSRHRCRADPAVLSDKVDDAPP